MHSRADTGGRAGGRRLRWSGRLAFAALGLGGIAAAVAPATASASPIVGTTTSVVASANPPAVGEDVAYQATVSPLSGTVAPTGTVTFADTAGLIGPSCANVPLVNGAAVCLSGPSVGGTADQVTATYTPTNGSPFQGSYGTADELAPTKCVTGTRKNKVYVGGSTCITNATLQNGLEVAPGGSVEVTSSSVTGQFFAFSPGAVVVCGSRVTGTLQVTGATYEVVIGFPGLGCGGNTITGTTYLGNGYNPVVIGNTLSGPTELYGNKGSEAVIGSNHVTGNITFNNNTAAKNVVSGNQVLIGPACNGNTPAPIDQGVPNRVLIPGSGQCRFL